MKKWLYLLIVVALIAGIYWFSSKDASESTKQSNDVIVKLRLMTEKEMLENPEKASQIRFVLRKSAHFMIYFVLGFFLFITLKCFTGTLGFSMFSGLILSIILAVVDEYHQSFVPGRSMEIRDVLIDSTGALLGMIFIYLYFKTRESKRSYKRVYYYGR